MPKVPPTSNLTPFFMCIPLPPSRSPRWYATVDLLTGIKNAKSDNLTPEGRPRHPRTVRKGNDALGAAGAISAGSETTLSDMTKHHSISRYELLKISFVTGTSSVRTRHDEGLGPGNHGIKRGLSPLCAGKWCFLRGHYEGQRRIL